MSTLLWVIIAAVAGVAVGAVVVALLVGRWVVGTVEEIASRR